MQAFQQKTEKFFIRSLVGSTPGLVWHFSHYPPLSAVNGWHHNQITRADCITVTTVNSIYLLSYLIFKLNYFELLNIVFIVLGINAFLILRFFSLEYVFSRWKLLSIFYVHCRLFICNVPICTKFVICVGL